MRGSFLYHYGIINWCGGLLETDLNKFKLFSPRTRAGGADAACGVSFAIGGY